MGRKPKTAGIPVNSPALLVCGPGPVPKVKLLVSANGGFSALPMSGVGGGVGRGDSLTIGKDSYAVLQSLIRHSQLTVKVTGIPKIEQFVYKSNRVQSYVKILIISKITFIFVTKIKMLTPLVQFPTITFKTATNSGSKTAFHFWWEVRVFVLFLNGAIKQG